MLSSGECSCLHFYTFDWNWVIIFLLMSDKQIVIRFNVVSIFFVDSDFQFIWLQKGIFKRFVRRQYATNSKHPVVASTVCLSVYTFFPVHLLIRLPACLPVCLPACPSACLPTCLPFFLSVSLSVNLSLSFSVSLSPPVSSFSFPLYLSFFFLPFPSLFLFQIFFWIFD